MLDIIFLDLNVFVAFFTVVRPKDTFVEVDEVVLVLVTKLGGMDEALLCLVVNFLGGKYVGRVAGEDVVVGLFVYFFVVVFLSSRTEKKSGGGGSMIPGTRGPGGTAVVLSCG